VIARRWRDACLAEEDGAPEGWPGAQSDALVEAILAPPAEPSAVVQSLDRATRAWTRVQPALEVLSRRLLVLRDVVVAATVPGDHPRLQDLWEVVAVTATEESALVSQRAALSDPLTGAGNRRALELGWEAALNQGRRVGQPVCLVAVDLDGLKQINDGRGHAAGDEAIVTLVAALRAALRDTDTVFRVGGDEFVVLLPGLPAAAADELVARVGQFHAPKFSWGAADTVQDGTSLGDVLDLADRRLYAQRSRVRAPMARAEVRLLPPAGPRWLPAFPTSRARAGEITVLGIAAIVIGSVVMSIAGGNHAACDAGAGSAVVDCALSNAASFGAVVVLVAGGLLAAVGIVALVLLRAGPPLPIGGTMVRREPGVPPSRSPAGVDPVPGAPWGRETLRS